MNLAFKDRMALYYMLASAVIIFTVYAMLYWVVQITAKSSLDQDLNYEAKKHTTEIEISDTSIHFINKAEWEEHEHREAQVNPVFIQIINLNQKIMDKSPNLKEQSLVMNSSVPLDKSFATSLNGIEILQVQLPIYHQNQVVAYVLAAMSAESMNILLKNLRSVLFISFPLVLLVLFFVSRFLAGRNIIPIRNIILTTDRIHKNNLKERVELPKQEDELYALSSSINLLLHRIENALNREKQFTSDASHELRTPLASLRGTLEVLIRKERTIEEYEEKVTFSLQEIDKLSSKLEQLMLLARLDETMPLEQNCASIESLLAPIRNRNAEEIERKNLSFSIEGEELLSENIPEYAGSLILDNFIRNAIKYSFSSSLIKIKLTKNKGGVFCQITDQGIGIKEEDLSHIFEAFYRSDALSHKGIEGDGLGLSIAKKAAESIGAQLFVESELGVGSTFSVQF
ncbi:MAG: HAMP domain-containing histidine kinase [Chitinophagales bacterium]|nr:HAMP domain-containing histidine kinase [Bacteroidota bacterium]MCB9256726.1 HAMP domain-containing histidine kinase [Chitinophagales bacterium]